MSRSPDSAVFKVTVIGSHDSQVQNEGTLETTPTSLVYTDNKGSKFTWQLKHIKKYGSNGDNLFTIETGSSCPTGPGVYIFSTPHAPYLESIIARYLTTGKASPDPDVFFSLPRNGLTSPSNGQSMLRSASLWTIPGGNQFPVRNITEGPGSQKEGVLEVTGQEIVYTESKTGKQYRWPITFLRQFGYDGNVFSFDASRRCQGGGGVFAFISHRAADIQDLVRKQSKSNFGSTLNLSSFQSPPVQNVRRVAVRSEDDDTPVFRRTNSFLRRARSAMDLNRNLFEVVNISDERREVGKGELEVTQLDLIYIDRKTEEKWRWPLRYLRRYGCDSNVFSFEAGRRCPGGEGLYAFSCERASEIHEAIVSSVSGPQKTAEPDFRASNMSLVDPSLMAQKYNRRTSEQLPVRKNRTPPSSRKQVPLPKTPTPPRSPQISEHSITPRGSVSSPSLDENDTSSVSSGVLTPPLSGMGTPPPKPPRNKERKRKAKKVKGQEEQSTKREHTYDDPVLAHKEYLESVSTSGGESLPPSPIKPLPMRQKPIPPPKPQNKSEQSLKTERKGKESTNAEKKVKKDKPPPFKKTNSLLKFLKRKSIGPTDSNGECLPQESRNSIYENLPESAQSEAPQPSMYANLSIQSPKHHSMYANIPRQGSVGRGEVTVFSRSLPATSSVPMPHRGDTPPPGSPDYTPSNYQNVELMSPLSPQTNTYANVEVRDKPVETFTPTQYTEIEIVDGVIPYNKSHDKKGTSHYRKSMSHDKQVLSHDKKRQLKEQSPGPAVNSSVTTSSDNNEEVAYQELNFRAMRAVATLQQQRGNTDQFAEILDRHTLKQDEVKALGKSKKRWS